MLIRVCVCVCVCVCGGMAHLKSTFKNIYKINDTFMMNAYPQQLREQVNRFVAKSFMEIVFLSKVGPCPYNITSEFQLYTIIFHVLVDGNFLPKG